MNRNGSNTCVDVMESSVVVVLIIYKYRKCSPSLWLSAVGMIVRSGD